MIAEAGTGVLLVIWIAFAALALAAILAVFIWAVRSRQFSHQDDARHLPLRSGIPEGEVGEQEAAAGKGEDGDAAL